MEKAFIIVVFALTILLIGAAYLLWQTAAAYHKDLKELARLTQWKEDFTYTVKNSTTLSITMDDADGNVVIFRFRLEESPEEWPAEVQ